MISIRVTMKDGMGRWANGLQALFRRKSKDVSERPLPATEPRTEAERALYQALGLTDDAWEDVIESSVSDVLR